MEDEVLEQEQVVETPVETVEETVVEEPVVEPETPVEEPVVEPEPEPVAEPAPEPMKIYTNGKWKDLEEVTEKELEVGKTYRITVSGHCQFAVSAEKPIAGIATNEITFTKQDGLKLWIKTGA